MGESQEPRGKITVHLDFNHLCAELSNNVEHSVRLVSIGLRYAEQPVHDELFMPGHAGFRMSFSGMPIWSPQETREHFTIWLLRAGLRDLLEAFGAYLDKCYEISLLMGLMRKNKEHGQVFGQDLHDYTSEVAKVRRLGVDKKIGKINRYFCALPSETQQSILSINRARNILVHHEGVIPESYLDDDKKFRLTWLRLTLWAMGADEREVQVGETLKGGEGLGIRSVSEHREFQHGERLKLEPLEFAGVSWSLFVAGNSIREALEKEYLALSGS